MASHAMPSRFWSSTFGSLGSARRTACASACDRNDEQLYALPWPRYRRGSKSGAGDAGAGSTAAGGVVGATVAAARAGLDARGCPGSRSGLGLGIARGRSGLGLGLEPGGRDWIVVVAVEAAAGLAVGTLVGVGGAAWQAAESDSASRSGHQLRRSILTLLRGEPPRVADLARMHEALVRRVQDHASSSRITGLHEV